MHMWHPFLYFVIYLIVNYASSNAQGFPVYRCAAATQRGWLRPVRSCGAACSVLTWDSGKSAVIVIGACTVQCASAGASRGASCAVAAALILFCLGWGIAFGVQHIRDKLTAATWPEPATAAQVEMTSVIVPLSH